MAAITLSGVTKTFSNGAAPAVAGVDLEVADGEFMVLVGPSGCGKSTLLRIIAGVEELTDGVVRIGDRDVTFEPARRRDIAMVFQNYALYPHLTVRDNVGFGLKMAGVKRADRRRRVDEVARLLGLTDLLARMPAHLSGGQRQRVAIGRAMVRNPQAYLMDEPLSNLDAKLRVSMRAELSRLHQKLGTTTVYVTHDQVEAMTLGARVAVMRDGLVQQCGTPSDVYADPANLFVAAFVGSPAINLVDAVVTEQGRLEFAGHSMALTGDTPLRALRGPVVLGVRPHDLRLHESQGDVADDASIEVEVAVVEELGSHSHAFFELAAPKVVLPGEKRAADADATILADDRAGWVAQLTESGTVRRGARIRLRVRTERLLAFSPTTGERLARPSL